MTAMTERPDIIEVIEAAGVSLRRCGKELVGLCLFHGDKHPSFTVNVEKQVWFCFACAEGGDAIRFIEKLHGVGFKEALQKLGMQDYKPSAETLRRHNEAKHIACWARQTSTRIAAVLRRIGNRICILKLAGNEADADLHEALRREWLILCSIDDDINSPSFVVAMWAEREMIDSFVDSL